MRGFALRGGEERAFLDLAFGVVGVLPQFVCDFSLLGRWVEAVWLVFSMV